MEVLMVISVGDDDKILSRKKPESQLLRMQDVEDPGKKKSKQNNSITSRKNYVSQNHLIKDRNAKWVTGKRKNNKFKPKMHK